MLSQIQLPSSITSLSNGIFANCSNLVNVHLSSEIVSIGNSAFANCRSLTDIILPNKLNSIGDLAFANCEKLNSIILPPNVISIGNSAFIRCHSFTSITIPNGITSIPNNCFYECTNLARISIPTSVTNVGSRAFSNCDNLVNITIPASVTTIGSNAFVTTTSVSQNVAIYSDSTSFGESVFNSTPTIYCYMYSDAEEWARTQGFPIVYFDETDFDSLRTIVLESNLKLPVGNTKTIEYSIFPDDGTEIHWSSSNNSILSVDDGVVLAVTNGIITVTATYGNATASIEIEVYTPANSINLSDTEVWIIAQNSYQLSVISFEPINASAAITWSSSDLSLAEVNSAGIVTTFNPGDLTITATTEYGVSQECLVHICYPVTTISFTNENTTIARKHRMQLIVNVNTSKNSYINKLIDFSSSDESIAVVDEHGLVTALNTGIVIITAESSNGVSATCNIMIRDANTIIIPNSTETIESQAFANLPGIDNIVIPNSVISISDDAFLNNNIIVIAPANSYAEKWAVEHQILVYNQE